MRGGTQEIAVLGSTDSVILQSNPHRRSIIISNGGPGSAFVSLGRPATGPVGIIIPPNFDPLILDPEKWGASIGMELHGLAVASTAGGATQVIQAVQQFVHAATPSLGNLVSYTVPAGNTAIWQSGWFHNLSAGSNVEHVAYTPSGGSQSDTGQAFANAVVLQINQAGNAGDQFAILTTTAAANTCDASMNILLYPPATGGGGGAATATLTIWTVEQ